MNRTRSKSASKKKVYRRRSTSTTIAPSTLRSIVRSEMRRAADIKYMDYANTYAISSTGAVYTLFTNMNRGDNGLNNFNGNIITPTSLRIRYSWYSNQLFNHVRCLVFQWFDDTTPVVTGILQSNATTLATLSDTLVTNKRFIRVLHDKTYVLAPTAGGDTTPTGLGHVVRDVYIPGSRLKPVRFNATVATPVDGQLYVLLISDDAALSYPQYNFYARLSYTD